MDEVSEIADVAKATFLRDGFITPTLIAYGVNGREAVLQFAEGLEDTPSDREVQMLTLGRDVALNHSVGDLKLLVFVFSGLLEIDLTDSLLANFNSIEVLQVFGLDVRTQEQQGKSFQIIRDPKGNVLNLKEMVFSGNVKRKSFLLLDFQKGYQSV